MALLYTPAGELGAPLPRFDLPDLHGEMFSSKSIEGAKAKLIAFLCGHCPYVQAIEDRLVTLGKDLQALSVPMLAICSNDSEEYPEDSAASLLRRANSKGYTFPYLIDESQTVAKQFGAVCTPDFFVFDAADRLVYRGRLDDSWKDASKVTKREMYEAIGQVVQGQKKIEQKPSMGCSIKWK